MADRLSVMESIEPVANASVAAAARVELWASVTVTFA